MLKISCLCLSIVFFLYFLFWNSCSYFNWLFTQTLSDNYHVLMYYCLFVCIDVDLEEATVRSSIWIQLLKPCRSSLYQPSSAPLSLVRCVLICVHSFNEWKHNTIVFVEDFCYTLTLTRSMWTMNVIMHGCITLGVCRFDIMHFLFW